MYILPITNIPITGMNNHIKPVFCSAKIQNDTFEKHKIKETEISLFSPFSDSYCKGTISGDLDKSFIFELPNTEEGETPIIADYDPSRTGVLRSKANDSPIIVNILKTHTENFPNSVCYHFMSKDLKHSYGYVHLFKPDIKTEDCELCKDYEDIGVVGDRIEVLYLRNFDDNKVKGVGKLADKLAVRYCMEEGIEPNIVSYADTGSHVAHYKRGKRFIEPPKGSDEWEFLKNTYNKTNPNEILKELIQNAEKTNDYVDLSGWGYLITYMPKETAEKYM